MTRYIKFAFISVLLSLVVILVLNPSPSMDAARHALHLCASVVIPSLFPFFICSRLLISFGGASFCSRLLSRWMHPLFGVPGGGALAVVLGVLSGYPVGAATIVNLYTSGACTKTEGERLLAFCNNAGPLFVLGSIGIGILHSQSLGILLYAVHLVTALLTGVLFRNYGRESRTQPMLPPSAHPQSHPVSAFADAISEGVSTMVKICGYVVFFSVVCAVIPLKSPLLHGLLEITGGIQSMAAHIPSHPLLLPGISAVLALSGASVFFQTAGIVLPAGLSMKTYLLGKSVQACLSFFLTLFLVRFLPLSRMVSAGTFLPPVLPTIGQLLTLTVLDISVAVSSVALLCLAGFLATKFQQKK